MWVDISNDHHLELLLQMQVEGEEKGLYLLSNTHDSAYYLLGMILMASK
jgi:hypothetical protein